MSAPVLSAASRRKAIASARLLDSPEPGEVAAAVQALKRLFGGMTLGDLLERVLPEPHPEPQFGQWISPLAVKPSPVPRATILRDSQRTALMCQAFEHLLNDWERQFVSTMRDERHPSERQKDRLKTIAAKIERLRK